ncbi:lipoprotein [Oceanobacillus picturae]|uniref:Lipoprotein n=1 Tax=Oceanobacillus picturae TaxID=171693 RepID=A0A0U9I1E2_9BACI|nr:lipoprotein [Oceanobacillus picturae]
MTMRRVLTALLSTILFSIIYSWIFYVPISQREPNVYYFGFLKQVFL